MAAQYRYKSMKFAAISRHNDPNDDLSLLTASILTANKFNKL